MTIGKSTFTALLYKMNTCEDLRRLLVSRPDRMRVDVRSGRRLRMPRPVAHRP